MRAEGVRGSCTEECGAAVIERVLKTISRYNMLGAAGREPVRLAVAVSGGPDSVGLLHILSECAERLGVALSVAHFNHKLRGAESEADEGFVAELAASMGLRLHLAAGGLLKGNVEQSARDARREFFAGLRNTGNADLIALGHTRDDQAETVLFRILRGAGPGGLAGILPATREGLIRPLLDVTRAEVEQYLLARGIRSRVDASNADLRFARNRIRNQLLPQLAREWNPHVSQALAQMAELAYGEERWWNRAIERRAAEYLVPRAGGVEFRARQVAALPAAVGRRLIRRAMGGVKGDLRGVEFDHVERVLELLAKSAGDGRVECTCLEVTRSFDWIRIAPLGLRNVTPEAAVSIPGRIELGAKGAAVVFEVADTPCATLETAQLRIERLPGPVRLRGWRPGDQYCPLGHGRNRKIHEMFQRARVPSWRRTDWPIVTGGGKILWARQFGAAAEFAAESGAGPVLRIFETSPETEAENR